MVERVSATANEIRRDGQESAEQASWAILVISARKNWFRRMHLDDVTGMK